MAIINYSTYNIRQQNKNGFSSKYLENLSLWLINKMKSVYLYIKNIWIMIFWYPNYQCKKTAECIYQSIPLMVFSLEWGLIVPCLTHELFLAMRVMKCTVT